MTTVGGHYVTLGVRPDASAAEIRDAYRALARRYHPDHAPEAATRMAAINEAYRVLGEPARRAVYDATLRGTGSAAVVSRPVRGRPYVPRPPGPRCRRRAPVEAGARHVPARLGGGAHRRDPLPTEAGPVRRTTCSNRARA